MGVIGSGVAALSMRHPEQAIGMIVAAVPFAVGGIFLWRIVCETLVVAFRIHESLNDISRNTSRK